MLKRIPSNSPIENLLFTRFDQALERKLMKTRRALSSVCGLVLHPTAQHPQTQTKSFVSNPFDTLVLEHDRFGGMHTRK